jgi:tetratricopeptide (TPR) repeat protein
MVFSIYLPKYLNFLGSARPLLILFLVLIGKHNAISQGTHSIDSIENLILSSQGIKKYEPLIAKARALYDSDLNESLEAALMARDVAIEYGDSLKVVESGRICGQLFNSLNRGEEAIDALLAVINLADRVSRTEYIKILTSLAVAFTARAEYDKALDIQFKLLGLTDESIEADRRAMIVSNIGFTYYRMRNYEVALQYFEKALTLAEEKKGEFDVELGLLNAGFCYNHLGKHNFALEYFEKVLKQCRAGCRTEIELGSLHGLGIVYFEKDQIEKAKIFFLEAEELARVHNRPRELVENLFWLAKVDAKELQYDSAISAFKQAERLSITYQYNELLISIYKELSIVFQIKRDYEGYASYLRKYVELKDSVYNQTVLNNLAKAKSDYDQRENLAIIKAKEMTIAQQHRFNMAVMIIAFLAGTLVIVLFRNNKHMKKVNVELMTAKDLIFQQNKELEMRNKELDKLVEKKTEELKLVNLSLKEMNDELNTFIFRTAQDIRSPLATLKGMCYVAMMDVKDESTREYVTRINSTTEHLQTILRRLLIINSINSTKVNPTVIDFETLVNNVIANQQRKGLPPSLLFRKRIEENLIVQCDQELLAIVLENSIENALKFCNNSWGTEHFIEIAISSGRNNRVNIRVIHNGIVTSEYNPDDMYEVFLDSMFSDPSEPAQQDLYFVKTAAKKIGAKVEYKKTPEGYSELNVVF